MAGQSAEYDVIVVGAGNAALCAALAARDVGASVVVLEKAPPSEQGGNCPYTGGGFRFVHDGIEDLRGMLPDLTDSEIGRISMAPYTADNFREHFAAVTKGDSDPALIETLIANSRPTVEWMFQKGVRWELSGSSARVEGAPSIIPNSVGMSAWESGPGLVRMLTTACRRAGVTILYETAMTKLLTNDDGAVIGVEARDRDGVHELRSNGIVLACGGFEANPEMRGEHIGAGWERARVRGAAHNTGDGIRVAMAIGAQGTGQWDGCHATPIDVDAPATGDLQVTDIMPRRSYPIGVTVNTDGLRFIDEGASFAEQTFVDMGHAVLSQTDGIAHQIFDSRAQAHLEGRYTSARRVEAGSVAGLAEKLGVDAEALERTVEEFNASAHVAEYEPRTLDGRSTSGLSPPKSNWAIKLDHPPYFAFTVTGGITYTYGGLKIDTGARVLNTDGQPIPGLFAAGIIVGGIFVHGSLRAAGLMHGAVYGRIAGTAAAGGSRT